MAEISIERLHLSVRASNVLHRMGIHSIEKLQVTPMEKIAAQRNIGVKTLGEIQAALRDLDTLLKQPVTSKRRSVRLEEDLQGEEEERVIALTEKQREELSKHSIEELNLSVRSYRVLCREGCRTLDRVVLAVPVFSTLRGLGKKSVDEIKEAVAHWLNEHFEEAGDLSEATVEEGLKSRLQELSTELHPVAALRWEQLYHYLEAEQLLQQAQHFEKRELLRTVLLLPQLKRPLRSFWEGLSRHGVIAEAILTERLRMLELPFDSTMLLETSIESGVLIKNRGMILLYRDLHRSLAAQTAGISGGGECKKCAGKYLEGRGGQARTDCKPQYAAQHRRTGREVLPLYQIQRLSEGAAAVQHPHPRKLSEKCAQYRIQPRKSDSLVSRSGLASL